jgi:cytochrome c biogenesis protein CcmG/thiol:disulfide interchange protein DsbE
MIRTKRFSALAVLSLALVSGCDRGERPQLIGKPAPEFTVKDSDRSVEETPSLVALQAQMKDRVLVFGVSTDQNEAAYHRFIKVYNVNFLTVRDSEQNSNRLYGTFAFPETYIIDREGILRRKFIGPVDWTKPEIIEYLSKL